MEIRLAAPLQSDSVVDGFGVRTVIWTQGCSHNCPFCQNPSTHSFDGGALFDIEDIKIKKYIYHLFILFVCTVSELWLTGSLTGSATCELSVGACGI